MALSNQLQTCEVIESLKQKPVDEDHWQWQVDRVMTKRMFQGQLNAGGQES